jgi:hypothetical protein
LIVFILISSFFVWVKDSRPDFESWTGAVRSTKSEGVISGNLSDRILADHGNIFGAPFAVQRLCRWQQTGGRASDAILLI